MSEESISSPMNVSVECIAPFVACWSLFAVTLWTGKNPSFVNWTKSKYASVAPDSPWYFSPLVPVLTVDSAYLVSYEIVWEPENCSLLAIMFVLILLGLYSITSVPVSKYCIFSSCCTAFSVLRDIFNEASATNPLDIVNFWLYLPLDTSPFVITTGST